MKSTREVSTTHTSRTAAISMPSGASGMRLTDERAPSPHLAQMKATVDQVTQSVRLAAQRGVLQRMAEREELLQERPTNVQQRQGESEELVQVLDPYSSYNSILRRVRKFCCGRGSRILPRTALERGPSVIRGVTAFSP